LHPIYFILLQASALRTCAINTLQLSMWVWRMWQSYTVCNSVYCATSTFEFSNCVQKCVYGMQQTVLYFKRCCAHSRPDVQPMLIYKNVWSCAEATALFRNTDWKSPIVYIQYRSCVFTNTALTTAL